MYKKFYKNNQYSFIQVDKVYFLKKKELIKYIDTVQIQYRLKKMNLRTNIYVNGIKQSSLYVYKYDYMHVSTILSPYMETTLKLFDYAVNKVSKR